MVLYTMAKSGLQLQNQCRVFGANLLSSVEENLRRNGPQRSREARARVDCATALMTSHMLRFLERTSLPALSSALLFSFMSFNFPGCRAIFDATEAHCCAQRALTDITRAREIILVCS